MSDILSVFSLLCSLLALPIALRLKSVLHHTTLRHAWSWGVAAVASVIAAELLRFQPQLAGQTMTAAAIHASSVMSLTPLIAVLGARRPGDRAWQWFVLLPMVVVLLWPAVSAILASSREAGYIVPGPALLGFLLVLVMGAGNYFGTRLTLECFLGSVGILLRLASIAGWTGPESRWPSTAGLVLLLAAMALSVRKWSGVPAGASIPTPTEDPVLAARTLELRRTWHAFRDLYGIVWAKRVLDRTNQFAQREKWALQLEIHGFQPREGSDDEALAPLEQSVARADAVLCWLLKRFVDATWLEQHRARPIPDIRQPGPGV